MKTWHECMCAGGIDSYGNYIGDGDHADILVFLNHSRDSNILTESNWIAGLELLGGESETVQIHRFSHWGCGWFELILIDPADTEKVEICDELLKLLEEYPVLDDERFSDMEWEKATDYWKWLNLDEKIDLCKKHDCNIFSARHNYIPVDDTGSLFEYLVTD